MSHITVTAPASGEIISEVPIFTTDQVTDAFDRSRRAQKKWAATPFSERREILLRYHDLVLERQDELLDVIQKESGKSRISAHEEILDNAITARHYANRAAALLRPKRAKATLPVLTTTHVEHAPIGAVGMISPWNYPLVLAISDAIAAIMAGNTVVLKPDSNTPLTALKAAELLTEAGLPDDVFQVTPGPGSQVGQAIAEQCDFLMFTGSTATGRKLAAIAGERLIGFSAELGGKNPLIVAPDADITRAARGAIRACFSNSGQLCISIERIYVHRDVADQFTREFVDNVKAMRVGPGNDWALDMGSLISAEHHETVSEFVEDAKAQGARVLTGGESLGGNFYAPTVLTDVPPTARVYREEVFGPVVYIQVVDSLDEAVEQANDTDYGLNASIWATPSTGRALASRIEAGTVNVNDGYMAAWASMHAPMGGWKTSGVGRRHSDHGLLKFTEARTIAVQRFMPPTGPEWMDRKQFAGLAAGAFKVAKRILP